MRNKVTGGALYYVIFICFILSTTLLFFLMLRTLKSKSLRQELDYYQKVEDLNSALTIYLSKPENYNLKDSINISPISDSSSSVQLKLSNWGIYDKITVITDYRGKQLSKSILAGMDPYLSDSIVLWVPDNNQAIYISGRSQIVGNIVVPRKGLQRASIEGKPLQSDKTFYGKVTNSSSTLPNLSNKLIDRIKSSLNYDSLSATGISISRAREDDLHNGFEKATTWLYSNEDLRLSELSVSQNLGIITPGSIIISKNCNLDRTIISAKNIIVEDGFKGSAQLFSMDTIIIGSNCVFHYPSVLCLFNNNVNNIYLEIGSSTIVEGTIISFQEYLAAEKPRLKLDAATKIFGQVYHRGTIELYGDIYGSLYCEDFYIKTDRAYYINHLLDINMDYTKIPEEVIFIDIIEGYSNQIIDFINEEI